MKRISAKDVRDDIRAGLDDSDLMAKYGLTVKGVESLFRKLLQAGIVEESELGDRMSDYAGSVVVSGQVASSQIERPSKKTGSGARKRKQLVIDALAAVQDIRSGMPDAELMRKYRLSTRGLQSLFKKLLDTGCIEQFEFDQRFAILEGTVDLHQFLDELALGRQNGSPTAAAESDREPEPEKPRKG
jgi:predicted transcriptional regulator